MSEAIDLRHRLIRQNPFMCEHCGGFKSPQHLFCPDCWKGVACPDYPEYCNNEECHTDTCPLMIESRECNECRSRFGSRHCFPKDGYAPEAGGLCRNLPAPIYRHPNRCYGCGSIKFSDDYACPDCLFMDKFWARSQEEAVRDEMRARAESRMEERKRKGAIVLFEGERIDD